MKKMIVIIYLSCIIISCGNQEVAIKEQDKQVPKTQARSESPEALKGLDLVAKSDCFTCHKISEQLVGPAYAAVAERYEASEAVLDTLSDKIIQGGAGRWGTVPMTPHPQISKEDARIMAAYVLSLKK